MTWGILRDRPAGDFVFARAAPLEVNVTGQYQGK
jgi:hypothetical protein